MGMANREARGRRCGEQSTGVCPRAARCSEHGTRLLAAVMQEAMHRSMPRAALCSKRGTRVCLSAVLCSRHVTREYAPPMTQRTSKAQEMPRVRRAVSTAFECARRQCYAVGMSQESTQCRSTSKAQEMPRVRHVVSTACECARRQCYAAGMSQEYAMP